MQPQVDPQYSTWLKQEQQYKSAVTILHKLGYELSSVFVQHKAFETAHESAQPSELDHKYATRLATLPPLGEHFEAMVLAASRCFKGRQYLLTPGQRALLRQRYGLTPTREVVVSEVELFEGTSVIRSFAIKSTLVVADRRHLLDAAVICPASDFFAEALRLEANSASAKEYAKFVTRIERLYLRAKTEQQIVPKKGNSAGGVAAELQAHCEANRITVELPDYQKQVREQLKLILTRRDEEELAKLVASPKFFPADEEREDSRALTAAIAAQYI
tara:strand:- start:1906 stop:2727 length:822 start_codon:yes stop_codon:yes gene_type:complete